MRSNADFPKAIVKYFSKTDPKNLEGDGLLLLIEIFDQDKFKEIATEDFVSSLFTALEYLKEEKVFYGIVNILITISACYEDPSKNLVLHFCHTHKYKRYFAEATLLLLNKGKSTFLDRTLKFVHEVFRFDKTRDEFFYSNDLNSLIDIVIREFTDCESIDLKVRYLEVLEGIFWTKDYAKGKHRYDDINEIFAEIGLTEGVDERITAKIDEMKPVLAELE